MLSPLGEGVERGISRGVGGGVSDINNRNYQLKLVFGDDDLKKPKHDEIMKWLQVWVSNVDNIRPFFNPIHPTLWKSEVGRLVDYTPKEPASSCFQDQVIRQFNQKHAYSEDERVKQPWPDAPPRSLRFLGASWEIPLFMTKSFPAGFADMVAVYEAGVRLERVTVNEYRHQVKTGGYYGNEDVFVKTGTHQEWREGKEERCVYFEVKTEIRSLGELMRQLQLYRSTETVRSNGGILVVVAPPHEDARQVCADHGIHFIDYRP